MNTPNTPSDYLFLVRGSDWDRSLSPAELQTTMAGFVAWFERLTAEGTIKAGHPLMNDGCTVAGRNGRIVADGPYTESKETVGGYLLVKADSMDHAVAIARQFPILEYGVALEIRPIAAQCPTMQRTQTDLSDKFAAAEA